MNIIKTFEGFTAQNTNPDLYEKLMRNVLLKCMGRTRVNENGDIHIDVYDSVMITGIELDEDFIIKSTDGNNYRLSYIEMDFNYTRSPQISLLVDLDSDEYPAGEYEHDGEIPIGKVANLEELVDYLES
jgi:hypothetical protein